MVSMLIPIVPLTLLRFLEKGKEPSDTQASPSNTASHEYSIKSHPDITTCASRSYQGGGLKFCGLQLSLNFACTPSQACAGLGMHPNHASLLTFPCVLSLNSLTQLPGDI